VSAKHSGTLLGTRSVAAAAPHCMRTRIPAIPRILGIPRGGARAATVEMTKERKKECEHDTVLPLCCPTVLLPHRHAHRHRPGAPAGGSDSTPRSHSSQLSAQLCWWQSEEDDTKEEGTASGSSRSSRSGRDGGGGTGGVTRCHHRPRHCHRRMHQPTATSPSQHSNLDVIEHGRWRCVVTWLHPGATRHPLHRRHCVRPLSLFVYCFCCRCAFL
jgi:hypothetical protein